VMQRQQRFAVQPLSLHRRLAIRLQIWGDLERVREGLLKLLAATPSEAKGRKLLLRQLRRNARLRREIFGAGCDEPVAGAPPAREMP